jgi:uncharacterized membrane protein YeaQ/YmgE (transglycosylase-associated protein family)
LAYFIPPGGFPTSAAEGVLQIRGIEYRQHRIVLLVDAGGKMNLIIWLVVGGVIGWIASLIMKTDAQQGLVLNVVVGIIGALLGGWLLSPLVGAGTVNQGDFSLMGLLVSLGGAIILLFIVNLVRRGAAPRA